MTFAYIFLRALKRSIVTFFELPKEIKDFGFQFAFYHILYRILLHWTNNSEVYYQKHKLILNYLEKDLSSVVSELKNVDLSYNDERVKKIWVFWYQGLEHAPEIVQKCRKLLRRNYENYEIIELDGDNYKKYCQLPDFVVDKRKKGLITITEFSDILRTKLLFEHGGMWVDSTLLCIGKANDSFWDLPFFTIKNYGDAPGCISGLRLSTYCQYYKQNNNYVGFLLKLFLTYWERHNVLIDYLLMDYLLILIANNNKQFNKMLDDVPYSNPNVHTLRNHINDVYSDYNWEKITRDTNFFKLTYKISLQKITSFGKKTNYGHIINYL